MKYTSEYSGEYSGLILNWVIRSFCPILSDKIPNYEVVSFNFLDYKIDFARCLPHQRKPDTTKMS